MARFLCEAGVKVSTVSDQYGAVHCTTGLDVPALEKYVESTGSVVGFMGSDPISGGELLELGVDLLVPATVEGVLDSENAPRVKAKLMAAVTGEIP